MSSIRPLATITLLAAMGIFLYMKINESPQSAASQSAISQAPSEWEDAPKFDFNQSAGANAPSADGAPSPVDPEGPAPSSALPAAPPLVAPAMPDLPPISAPVLDNSPPSEPLAAPPAASDTTTATAPVNETPDDESRATQAPLSGLPPIPELPPLPEASTATEPPGPVALVPPAVAEPAAATPEAEPTATPFDAARPAIHAALSQGELARAHLLVSKWYNESALTRDETGEVQTLLNQLAGTVVYSNEHHLEPAHVVQAGETLETIAAQRQVPWQLLAKINGIPAATAIQPGQSIKVIRGPFMGVIDVSDAELAVWIDGRFAGKFPVELEGAATSEGEWNVEQKKLEPAVSAAPVDRKLLLRSADNASNTVVIAHATTPTVGTAPPQGTIRIAPEQAEDLYDMLSVGSRVVIRR